MENMLNFTPIQIFFLLALNAWVMVIFPLLVIRKLNYLTQLVESQFESEDSSEEQS